MRLLADFCLLSNASAGGVAQERVVCKRMLKFVNISTTPLEKAAVSVNESRQNEEQIERAHSGGAATVSKELKKIRQ